MDFKTTLFLALAVIIIGGAFWLLAPVAEQSPTDTPDTTAQTPETEYIFDPQPSTQSIVRVEIAQPDAEPLVFEREPTTDTTPANLASWRLTAPVPAAVDSWSVRSLLNTLRNVQTRAAFRPNDENAVTAADAGLTPPTATITMTDEEGTQFALEIGKHVVMSTDTYVRVPGEQVIHIAKRDLLPMARKKLDDYRSKTLLELAVRDIVVVDIKRGDDHISMTRGDDGTWVLDAPLKAYADKDKVRSLLTRISGLRATEFIADQPESFEPFGLADPAFTITLVTATEQQIPAEDSATTQPVETQTEIVRATHRIALGDTDLQGEQRYVRVDGVPWVATIPEATVNDLVPSLADLRDPAVARVAVDQVTSVVLQTPAGTAELTRVDDRWQGAGDVADLDDAAVTQLLEAIADLRAIDYILMPDAPAKYGLAEPRARLTITASGRVEPLVISIGDETASGRNAYVQRDAGPDVIVTTAQQAERLAIDPLRLRSRQVFDFPADGIQRMTVTRPAMVYELVRSDENWLLEQPEDAPIEPVPARTLAIDLARLRAAKVVAREAFDEYGLNPPLSTIEFTVAPAPPSDDEPSVAPPTDLETHTLAIGRVAGICYARKDNEPYIYELDETVYRVLSAELIDTKLFDFKPDDIAEVFISGPGGELELGRRDDEWVYPPDPFVKLDQTRVQEFVDDLADFAAEGYFAYRGGDLEAEQLTDPPARAVITLRGGQTITLHMTPERRGGLPRKAAVVENGCIFRMRQADCEKLLRGLDDYIKPDKPAQPATPPSPGMPRP